MTKFQVSYDTMCDFNAIDDKYDTTSSNTSVASYDADGKANMRKEDLGSVIYEG